jgi:hypothetical protein
LVEKSEEKEKEKNTYSEPFEAQNSQEQFLVGHGYCTGRQERTYGGHLYIRKKKAQEICPLSFLPVHYIVKQGC